MAVTSIGRTICITSPLPPTYLQNVHPKNSFMFALQETLLSYIKKYKHRQLTFYIPLTVRITVNYNQHIYYQCSSQTRTQTKS